MTKPILSVIIPVYNAEKTLKRCVESILNQSFEKYEMILVNDGSKDNSGNLCDEFALKDSRICVVHKENGGVSSARNAGIVKASGSYLMFVDCDDSIKRDFFETYINMIQEQDCDVVIGGYELIQNEEIKKCIPEKNGVYGIELWDHIAQKTEQYGYICSKIFRMKLIKENNILFSESMYSQEDLDFCLSVYNYCQKFCLIDNTGYQYYYEAGKRKPPIADFIRNQLKVKKIAEEKGYFKETAEEAVCRKILLLIYSFLYSSDTQEEFFKNVKKLEEVAGLTEYLQGVSGTGEKIRVARWYVKKQYHKIYNYYKVRNKLRDFVRLFR